MNDPFESRLAATPRAPLDPAWRGEILAAAAAASSSAKNHRRPPAPQEHWRTGWRIAWAGLSTLWAAVALIQWSAASLDHASRRRQPSSRTVTTWKQQLELQRKLLGTLLRESDAVIPEPPTRHPSGLEGPAPRGDHPDSGFGRHPQWFKFQLSRTA